MFEINSTILHNCFTKIRSYMGSVGLVKKKQSELFDHILSMNQLLQDELEMIISEQSDTHSPPFAEDGYLSGLRQQKVAPPKEEKDV